MAGARARWLSRFTEIQGHRHRRRKSRALLLFLHNLASDFPHYISGKELCVCFPSIRSFAAAMQAKPAAPFNGEVVITGDDSWPEALELRP
jgi:hypothetical protein